MKKTIFLFLGLAVGFMAEAQKQQVKTPAPSPKAVINQTVGLTNFEITYSRPSLRNRDLHKEIVPLGENWRFGANESTTITFDTPISFGGKDLKPGTFAVFALPGEKEWTIMLYTDTDTWGVPRKLDQKKVVAEIKVPVKKTDNKVETFTLEFTDLGTNEFNLQVSWENTLLSIPVTLPTKELTAASIKEVMAGKPSQIDYFRASSYYLLENINLEDALVYADKAIELKGKDVPAYYIYNKAVILQKLGKNDEAAKTAKECIEVAKKQNYDTYVQKSEELIKEVSR